MIFMETRLAIRRSISRLDDIDKHMATNIVDPAFPRYREEFCKRYVTPSSALKHPDLQGLLGRTRMYELFSKGIPHSHFSHKIQSTVIGIFKKGASRTDIWKWISAETQAPQLPANMEKICGLYKYWRCFPSDTYQTISKVRMGYIKLSMEDGALRYDHKTEIHPDPIGWEDSGFAFLYGSLLYMLGFRDENIRSTICRIPSNPAKKHFHGLVLSKSDRTSRIYSAAFVMFHESHPKYMNMHEMTIEEFSKTAATEPLIDQRLMMD